MPLPIKSVYLSESNLNVQSRQQSSDRRLLGMALRVLAATSLAMTAALVKAASERGVTTAELVFYRSACAMPVLVLWITVVTGWVAVRTRRPIVHLSRSALGVLATALSFLALALLPLGEAVTLMYTSPLIAAMLSAVLLRERIDAARWLAVAIGFGGVVLVMRPGAVQSLALLGVTVGLAAAMGQAAVAITVRHVTRTETATAIAFWFTTFTALVGLALLPIYGNWHSPETLMICAACGVTGGIGQLAMTGSLKFAPISVVVPLDYLQILWAVLLGWLIFASPVFATTLAGALLIAAAGIYNVLRERSEFRTAASNGMDLAAKR